MPVETAVAHAAASHMTGYLFNMILYGILVLQSNATDLYHISFPRDSRGIKALVLVLFGIETLQTIMMMHDAIVVFGLEYGDPMALRRVHLAWFSVPILSCTVSSIVQTFFAWRIWVLGRSAIVPLVILAIVLMQLGSGVAQGILSYMVNDFTDLPEITAGIWLVSAAVCDVLIAVCMTYILSRKQDAFGHINILLTRIIKMTVETGSITAVIAVITAGLHLGMPHTNYFVPPSYILGKLYANNLLVILNSRINMEGIRASNTTREPFGPDTLSTPSIALWSHSTRIRRHEPPTTLSTISGQDSTSTYYDEMPVSPLPPVKLASTMSRDWKLT